MKLLIQCDRDPLHHRGEVILELWRSGNILYIYLLYIYIYMYKHNIYIYVYIIYQQINVTYAYNWINQNTSPWNEKTLWYRIHPCLLSTTDLGIFFVRSLWCNGNVCNVAYQPQILVEWTSSLRCILYKKQKDTVDGWNPAPVQIVSLSHYLQGFIHPRWCRISAINRITETYLVLISQATLFFDQNQDCQSESGNFRWSIFHCHVSYRSVLHWFPLHIRAKYIGYL